MHTSNSNALPNRRKSVGHIPLSPLARTPSPSPLPSSPTRSPSPLAFPLVGHQPGASNTTQSYSPGSTTLPTLQTAVSANSKKAGFARTKSTEPSSPLLRRALSPDRLHPRSAETKISPLCCSPPIKQQTQHQHQRVVAGTWRPAAAGGGSTAGAGASQQQQLQDESQRSTATTVTTSVVSAATAGASSSLGDNQSTNNVVAIPTSNCEILPRIAEEKDSPTSTQDSSSVSEGFMPAIEEYAEGESSSSPTQTLEKKPSSKEPQLDKGKATAELGKHCYLMSVYC